MGKEIKEERGVFARRVLTWYLTLVVVVVVVVLFDRYPSLEYVKEKVQVELNQDIELNVRSTKDARATAVFFSELVLKWSKKIERYGVHDDIHVRGIRRNSDLKRKLNRIVKICKQKREQDDEQVPTKNKKRKISLTV